MLVDKFRNDKRFFLGLQFFLSALFILPYFFKNQILYGEAQFFLNWNLWLEKTGNTWIDFGMGTFAGQGIGNNFPVLYIWSFLEKIGISFHTIQAIWFFLLFFLPFLFLYLLLTNVFSLKPWNSFLISSFYIYNPIFLQVWLNVNPWAMPIFYLLPMTWLIVGHYWENNKKMFAWTAIAFFCSLSIFANPPYVIIFLLNAFISVLFFGIYFKEKTLSRKVFLKMVLIFFAFLLISNFILANIFLNFDASIGKYLSAVNPAKILKLNSSPAGLDKIFVFKHLFSDEYFNFSFLSRMMSLKPLLAILAIPAILFVSFPFIFKRNKPALFLTGCFLVIVFFMKGINDPFGSVFVIFFNHVPLFNMFKSAPEKFSPLLMLVSVIYLALIFKFSNVWAKKIVANFLIVWVIFFSVPVVSFNLISEINHLGVNITHFYGKGFINETVEKINKNKLISSVVSLPGSFNYLILLKLDDGRNYYLGLDPIINNLKKKSIEAYSDSDISNLLFNSILGNDYKGLFSLLNVQYVILDKNINPGFGFFKKANANDYEKIIGSELKSESINGAVDLYKNENFLPRIYIPQSYVISQRDMEEIPRILSKINGSSSFGIFLENQNIKEGEALSSISYDAKNLPTLEFKKISPVKYRVVFHHASGTFPMIFSESFHGDWKAYLEKIQNPKSKIQSPNEYEQLDGNEGDQADKNELAGYIKNGWITSMGSDFISKNFQGTIQNDNLPDGKIWETWFRNPIDNNQNHSIANGYANSWIINAGGLCDNNSNCVKNSDGTYDFEIVVEFWQQRLFYAGVSISAIVFLACLGYLAYSFKKRDNRNKLKLKNDGNN